MKAAAVAAARIEWRTALCHESKHPTFQEASAGEDKTLAMIKQVWNAEVDP